ncbi:hypothetical protein MJO29_015174 [Puccinia striiformis f. sp. tritici]|uniref:Secreted protein n=1 Tax=Puccinia striiformis f. sp. tritici PST-78 TaxID=1165861 RepID=A0A0L0UTN0_9BASI|nr:hypothetical protein Pst134EA_028225 [Puccinia striiformis f. sp. tritici]KAH9448937.1 hypothetical protein Pst134EA_028225 [Puccinia striiformis f. sp. tritici]KAI7937859.1 hypothetical protein MJO29_015174 [Puccinia striiformis f. sp. tritici]KNE90385.1 hypothetical protein PSTG_16164 [Puccinia striiformis f. sp. tritici PST-78]
MSSRFAVLLATVNLVLAQGNDPPVINTPASVAQCLPALLTFHGGVPPYTLSAIPAGQPGALPLVELGQQSGDSFTWIANLASGTATTLQIRDSRGNINYSQAVTIQPNSDDACLKSGSSPTPTTPSPAPGPGTPSGTAPPGVTTGTATASPPSKGGNNSTSAPGAHPNTTAPATTPATTTPATTPNTTATTTNSTKGNSPFVPTFNNTSSTTPATNNNANTAASNAPTGAASSVSEISQQAFFAGLAVAASVMTLFA